MKNVVHDPEKVTRILKASLKLFAASGYAKTNTDAIAAEAEVSKGLLFHYFGNKTALYRDTYQYAFEFLMQRIDPTVWTDAKDLTTMIRAATEYKIKLQLQYPTEVQFLMRAYADINLMPKDVQAAFRAQIDQDQLSGQDMMDQLIDKLELRPGVSAEDVKLIVPAVTGIVVQQVIAAIATDPHKQRIEDLQPEIDHIAKLIDILEHGSLA